MAVSTFHAISDPTRRQILDLLRGESLTAGAIAGRIRRMSRPAVSKHLSILRRSRLVRAKKAGRERIYTLNADPLREVDQWVQRYQAFWQQKLYSLKEYVESADKEKSHDQKS